MKSISESTITQTSVVLGVFVKCESNGMEVNEYIGWIGQFCHLLRQRDYHSAPIIPLIRTC